MSVRFLHDLDKVMRFSTPVSAFLLLVFSVAILVVLQVPGSWAHYAELLLFAAAIGIASSLVIHNPAGGVLSSSLTIMYVVAYIFEPASALLAAGLGYGIGNTISRGWVTWRACFNAAQMGLSVAFASFIFRFLGGDLTSSFSAIQIVPAAAAALAHSLANNFFVSFFFSRARGTRFVDTYLDFTRGLFLQNLLGFPTALLVAWMFLTVHKLSFLLFLVILPSQRWATKLYLEKRDAYSRIVASLVRAAELSQPGMEGHSRRVAKLAVEIARRMGLPDHDVESVEFASLLHDIGRIGADGSLDVADDMHEDNHAEFGAEIAKELLRPEIVEIVRNHHIPWRTPGRWWRKRPTIHAGVVALSEYVESSLNGLHPFSSRCSLTEIQSRVWELRGTTFAPEVVDAFLGLAEADRADLELEARDSLTMAPSGRDN